MPIIKPSIKKNIVVSFEYILRNSEGKVLDITKGNPLSYLHGGKGIVPGLTRQMEGRRVGERFEAVVAPAEGYGLKQGPGPQAIPRAAFRGTQAIVKGMRFTTQGANGSRLPVWVTQVEPEVVYVDTQHPLAGETLHFSIEIISLRRATAQERASGHPDDCGACTGECTD